MTWKKAKAHFPADPGKELKELSDFEIGPVILESCAEPGLRARFLDLWHNERIIGQEHQSHHHDVRGNEAPLNLQVQDCTDQRVFSVRSFQSLSLTLENIYIYV